MKLILEVFTGRDSQFTFEHTGTEVDIGRDPGCHLVLSGALAQSVSWHHARIDCDPDGVRIMDLKSSNGTYLNDRRLSGPEQVRVGDHVRLGKGGPYLRVVKLDLLPVAKPDPPRPPSVAKTVRERMGRPSPHGDDHHADPDQFVQARPPAFARARAPVTPTMIEPPPPPIRDISGTPMFSTAGQRGQTNAALVSAVILVVAIIVSAGLWWLAYRQS
jgi:FHA domain